MSSDPKRHLRGIRLLVECYHAFERLSAAHVRSLRLTPSQFDIIATLGNTPGMSFRELGAKTLITKGTLTGVVDRLEMKGLVQRVAAQDRRSTIVRLTPAGEREFARVFAPHVAHCGQPFAGYREADFVELERVLGRLQQHLLESAPD